MNKSTAYFLGLTFFILTGFSWENPSPSGDTVSPGETALAAVSPLAAQLEPEQTAPEDEAQEAPIADEAAPVPNDEAEPASEQTAVLQNLEAAKITLEINDAKNQKVYRGWPLILKVSIEASGKAVVLERGEGGWQDFVEIEIKDEKGRLHAWPMRLAPVPRLKRRIVLESGEAVSLVFLAAKEDMRAKAGTYAISAVAGDKIKTVSDVTVRVADHPESLSEDDERMRAKITKMYDVHAGKEPAEMRQAPPPQPAPQIIYVEAEPQQAPSVGDGGISDILGVVSELGLSNAHGGDYDYDSSVPDFTDYAE